MGEGGESSAPRRGPRPTDTAWREQILDAARREFGEHGYQAATVRRIGHAAGVDPKLVHYYFGTKEELFTTTIAETFRARGFPALLAQASSPPADSAGPATSWRSSPPSKTTRSDRASSAWSATWAHTRSPVASSCVSSPVSSSSSSRHG